MVSAQDGGGSRRWRALARYEIGEQLAVGGMGVIHRAYDRIAEREVAYKRLTTTDDATRIRATALFQSEYETLLSLQHPNIVRVYDFGVDVRGPYYAMELLSGEDLTRAAPLPFREACRLLRDIASALALLHARRLIHRDVSPNNIRLTSDGRAKLIDFGGLTSFGLPKELVGTPACIAPECLTLTELDQRSDLYSLGAVAYWALTRATPVRARVLEELVGAWDQPPPAPSALVPTVPKELDELVLSLLAREPLHRPASAAHVIDRLTSIAELGPEPDEKRVAYSYLARPPLCGRDDLLTQSAELLRGALAGQGCAVLIEGSAGAGRSALLEGIATQAQLSGATVLRASCEPGGRAFSLSNKLVDAATALYPDLDVTLLRLRHSSIYSEGAQQALPTPVEVAEHHSMLLGAAEALLLDVARRDPLVIIIDDLQASDSESLALIASLSRTAKQSGTALFASMRSAAPTQNASAHSLLEATAQRWSLRSFSEQDVAQLVDTLFGGVPNSVRLSSWLHTQSAGNVATCLDLARVLLQREVVRYRLGTFIVPHEVDADLNSEDISGAMLARLGDLSVAGQAIASALSLRDGSLTAEQLAKVTDVSVRDVQLSLDELTARGVVVKSDGEFSLPASSLRHALQQQGTPETTKALHVRLARVLLADSNVPYATRFAAVKHLIDAGEEAEAADLMAGIPLLDVLGSEGFHSIALIEAVLAIYKRQKRSREQCLSLTIALVNAGYYVDLTVQKRYIDETLEGLSTVCGISLARRCRPYLGGKLALGLGVLWAALRRAFTPKRERLGTLSWMLHALVGVVSNAVAAAASSLDTASALRFNALLKPFDILPKDTAGYLMTEFCLATTEVSAGRFSAAAERYRALIPRLSKDVPGLLDYGRLHFLRGCLNGLANAELQRADASVLEIADELGRGDAFFATHAEVIRMGHYAIRGEQDKADAHRARAERLALRGGTSWSAMVPLTSYVAYAAMYNRDAIPLEAAIAEMDRHTDTIPGYTLMRSVARARLEQLRGRADKALTMMRGVAEASEAAQLITWRSNYVLSAAIMNAAGKHAEAEKVCRRLLGLTTADELMGDQGRMVYVQLAAAQAGMGELESARRTIDEHLTRLAPVDNPLEFGEAHHLAAQIAIMDSDAAGFEHHLSEMERHFRTTRNPALLSQCETLKSQARQAGLRHASLRNSSTDEDFDGSTTIESFPTRQLEDAVLQTPDNDVEQELPDAHNTRRAVD